MGNESFDAKESLPGRVASVLFLDGWMGAMMNGLQEERWGREWVCERV